MIFRAILNELLATTMGAVAVVFLDWEGETVELVCDRDVSDHDLRIIGAYQGIHLTRLRELCGRVEGGEPARFKLQYQRRTVYVQALKDGYYLVLMVQTPQLEALSWRSLDRCCARLLEEM
ncbi:MAG TPA: hypothetical protein VFL80_06450 [Thermoanaerobaculia bacterium]|nr:hypothetical protein [Thermoanaerobaculia bacterium]